MVLEVNSLLLAKLTAYERLRNIYLQEIQTLSNLISEMAENLGEQADLVRRAITTSACLLLCLQALGIQFAQRIHKLREIKAGLEKVRGEPGRRRR